MWQLRDIDSQEIVGALREHDALQVDALTIAASPRALTLSGAVARVNDMSVDLPHGLCPGDEVDTGAHRLRVEIDSAATLLRDTADWWLVGVSEEVADLRLRIGDEAIVIGRDDDCDIVLDEGHVSRHHARIERLGDGVWLTDLTSRNGTFVDGQRLRGACRLHGGEALRFDQTQFTMERETEQQSATLAAEDPNRTLLRDPANGAGDSAAGGDERSAMPRAESAIPPAARQPVPASDSNAAAAPESSAGNAGVPIADQPTVITPAVPPVQHSAPRDAPRATPPGDEPAIGGTAGLSPNSHSGIEATVQMDNAGQPVVIINGGPTHGRVTLVRVGRMTIGRAQDCDIVIPERSVSLRHAQLTYRPPRHFTVSNLLSSNGILVNGTRVESAQLTSGDVISLGRVELVFAEDAAAARRIQRRMVDTSAGFPNWAYALFAFAGTIGVMAAGFYALSCLGYLG